MKVCLLCKHKERKTPRGPDPTVPFICAGCVQVLARMSREDLTARYISAWEKKDWRQAYALYSFVPHKVRARYPLKKSVKNKIA